MITTFVEYDESGEIFHVCQIDTTEGPGIIPPPFDASDKEKKAHSVRVQMAIQARVDQTKAELNTHRQAGKRLLVVPDNAEVPSRGIFRVDHAQGKIIKRTSNELANWRAAEEAKINSQNPNKP